MKRKISSAAFYQLNSQESSINHEWNAQKRKIKENSLISSSNRPNDQVQGYISRVKEIIEGGEVADKKSSSHLNENQKLNSVIFSNNPVSTSHKSSKNVNLNFNLNLKSSYLFSLPEQNSELEMEEMISASINTILCDSRRVSEMREGQKDKKIKFNVLKASKKSSSSKIKAMNRKINSSKNVVTDNILKDKMNKDLSIIKHNSMQFSSTEALDKLLKRDSCSIDMPRENSSLSVRKHSSVVSLENQIQGKSNRGAQNVKKDDEVEGIKPILKRSKGKRTTDNSPQFKIILKKAYTEDFELNPRPKLLASNIQLLSENKKKVSYFVSNDSRQLFILNKIYDSLSNNEDAVGIESHQFLITPDSLFKCWFDTIILLFIMINIVYLPIRVAFPNSIESSKYLDIISDLVFTSDIVISMLTAYKDDSQQIVFEHKLIMKNYFTGYFFIDFLSFLSFLYTLVELFGLSSINPKSFYLLSCIRLFKIFKASNLRLDFVKKALCIKLIRSRLLKSNISKLTLHTKFFNFVFKFLGALHIIACIYVYLANLDIMNSWISNAVSNSNGFEPDPSNFDIYFASIYFHLVTILTVGFGDIHSISINELIYNSIFLFVGIGIYSLTISYLSKFEIDDERTKKYNSEIDYLNQIRTKYPISERIYKKIIVQVRLEFEKRKTDHYLIFNHLPTNLKQELVIQMNNELFKHHKFFKYFQESKNFVTQILLVLKLVLLSKSDCLLQEGQLVEETYLVKTGTLSLKIRYSDIDVFISSIASNEHFGESFSLLDKKSPVVVKAKVENTEVYILRKFDLISILLQFPYIFDVLFQKSTYNMVRLLKLIEDKKKDVNKYLQRSDRPSISALSSNMEPKIPQNPELKGKCVQSNSELLSPNVYLKPNNTGQLQSKDSEMSIYKSLVSLNDDDNELIANPLKLNKKHETEDSKVFSAHMEYESFLSKKSSNLSNSQFRIKVVDISPEGSNQNIRKGSFTPQLKSQLLKIKSDKFSPAKKICSFDERKNSSQHISQQAKLSFSKKDKKIDSNIDVLGNLFNKRSSNISFSYDTSKSKKNKFLRQLDKNMEISHEKINNPNDYFSSLINCKANKLWEDSSAKESKDGSKPSFNILPRFEKEKVKMLLFSLRNEDKELKN